jgi:hypothetical protein
MRPRCLARDDRHGLDHLGDEGRGDAIVAMATLRLDGDEAAVEEFRKVSARRRRCDPREESELLRGTGAPVHEREEDAQAGRVADDGGDPGEVRLGSHGREPSRKPDARHPVIASATSEASERDTRAARAHLPFIDNGATHTSSNPAPSIGSAALQPGSAPVLSGRGNDAISAA